MRRAFSIAAAVLFVSSFSVFVADAEDAKPRGQAPAMVSARLGDVGNLTITRVVLVPEQRTEIRKVPVIELRTEIVGGKTATKAVTIEREEAVVTTRFAEVVQESDFSKTGFQVRDLDGKKIEGAALEEAFSKARPVLLLSGVKELDPFYAAFFKPGTLVVFLEGPDDTAPRAVPLPAVGDPKLPRPAIKPLPAAPAEIRILPAPALPAPPPAPAPPK